MGCGFSFLLDTQNNETSIMDKWKKKRSPSTLRRSERRRKEFLDKKLNVSSPPGVAERSVERDDSVGQELPSHPVLVCL